VHLGDVEASDGPGGEKILSCRESRLLFEGQRIDKCLDICQFVTPYALHDARERYSHDYKNNSTTLQEAPLRAGDDRSSPTENACLSSFEKTILFLALAPVPGESPHTPGLWKVLTPKGECDSNDRMDELGGSQPQRRAENVPPTRATRAAGADQRQRQRRGDLRRRQILDAAVELFAAKGYRGTGLAALGDRVGMTATGLLYYFGSKERLLFEVVAERDRADALGDEPTAPGLTLSSLRNLGRHNVETAMMTRLYVVLGAESLDSDEPLHDFFVDRYEVARGFVRSILESEQQQGTIRSDVDIDARAREIIAMAMGLEVQWLADPQRVDLATAFEAYMDRLVEELAPK
jgi:AcrR family transcriptional regulator